LSDRMTDLAFKNSTPPTGYDSGSRRIRLLDVYMASMVEGGFLVML